MLTEQVLQRIRTLLEEAFGDRLEGIVLYGSEARHTAQADSDIDLLVLLKPPVNQHDDSWTCIRALYDLVLELERPIHAQPIDIDTYNAAKFPLYQTAKREGIAV